MAAFSDPDQVEQSIGVRVEDMTPDQLVCYVKESMKLLHQVELVVDGFKERAVFRAMQANYGKVDTGQIVKWAFYRHRGEWKGEKIQYFSFAKGRKWWVDMMHMEMQGARRREKPRTSAPTATVIEI